MQQFKEFLDFEFYPKLRTFDDIDGSIKQFLWENRPMVLFMEEENNELFKNIAMRLPKKFIFLRINEN